jgi:hypothetical protein
MPCRAHAVPLPRHAALLPFSDSAVSFVRVRVLAGNIRTAIATVYRIGMLLITTFVKLRVVAGRSRMRAGCPHAVSEWSMLIRTCNALGSRFHSGIYVAWHGLGMSRVNQTPPHCVN